MCDKFFRYVSWLGGHIPPPKVCATSWVDWIPISCVITSYSLPGDVVEFGCWRGASASALSGACEIAGKRLFVFDSFQGFPDLDKYGCGEKKFEGYAHPLHHYRASLDEAKQTVQQFGCPEVVVWVAGFFTATLPKQQEPERIAVAFVDVDLPLSQKEAFDWVWPRMVTGGVLFSHEWKIAERHKSYGEHSAKLKCITKPLGYLVKGQE